MKRCLIITTLCFILGMCNSVFSQDTEMYYKRGVNMLDEGMKNLKEFKQVLDKGLRNQRVGEIREKCSKETRLSYFLDIFKQYYPDNTYTEAICRSKIYEPFTNARKEFDEAIKMDNTFIDAYLLKAYASIEMGDYSEALRSFEKSKSIGIEIKNIRYLNPFDEQMEDLFYSLGDEVMKMRLLPPKGKNYKEWAKEVIELFKGWRKDFLDKEIKKIDEKIDEVNNPREKERLKRKLKTQKARNYFELVRFYTKHHLKEDAESEYERVIKEGEVIPSEYPGIIDEVKGYGELKEVNLTIDNKENNALANEFKKPVRFRFFMDNDYFSCDYLYLSFLPSGCKVEFKDELSCELSTQSKIYLEAQTNPTCEIILPEIVIKKEDNLPFYVTVDNEVPSHQDKEKKITLNGPTSFEIMFEKGDVRKYPRMEEEYELKKDENNEYTIIQTIKKRKGEGEKIIEEVMQEKFKKNARFTSKITISPFAGEKVKIIKATWPISKEKNWDRGITGLFILPVFFLR